MRRRDLIKAGTLAAVWPLGRLSHRGELPSDARWIFDQREQPHPPPAPGAGEAV